MRVLLTTDTVGGIWTFTMEMTLGLLKRGHAVALVSVGRKPSAFQRKWAVEIKRRFGDAFCYEASDAPLEWMDHNESAYTDVKAMLLRLIDEFEADVLHSSQFCFGALPVEIPKLVTAHSDVLSWADACRPCGIVESNWLRRYKNLVSTGIAGADLIVSPTRWMRDALGRNFTVSTADRVVHNGRTLASSKRLSGQLEAVAMGRVWDEAKGLAVLDEADICMPVFVIGEVCFEGKRAPQSSKLKYLGILDQDQVLDVLRSSSLYLATSIYEPFGLAPLEAALCGCGVIARDIASLREVWGGGAEYFSDGPSLNRLMSRLHESSADLEALRSRSLTRALELSASRMVDGYIRLYQDLLTTTDAQEEVAAYAT